MWPGIVALVMFLLFLIFLGTVFLQDVLRTTANVVVLYFLALRIWTEIKKYCRGEIYALCAAASLLVVALVGNFLPFWFITTAALLMFALVQLFVLMEK